MHLAMSWKMTNICSKYAWRSWNMHQHIWIWNSNMQWIAICKIAINMQWTWNSNMQWKIFEKWPKHSQKFTSGNNSSIFFVKFKEKFSANFVKIFYQIFSNFLHILVKFREKFQNFCLNLTKKIPDYFLK